MMCDVFIALPVLLMAVWWYIQRRLVQRKVVYIVNAVLFCLSVAAMFWLREVNMEAGKIVFLFVVLLVACTVFWGICDVAGIEPQCRRDKRLAAIPVRNFSGSSLRCELPYAKIQEAMARQAESACNGHLNVVIELSFCRWEANLVELPGGGWAMALCDCLNEDEMIDAEIDAIGERHGVERLSQLLDAPATAVVLYWEQQLCIYPMEYEEEVKRVLQHFTCLTPPQE